MNNRGMGNKIIALVLALAALCLFTACGGGAGAVLAPQKSGVSAVPLYGAALKGVTVLPAGDAVELSFENVADTGVFLRLDLPPGTMLAEQNWSNDAQVLRLAAPVAEGVEVGVVPLPGYTGGVVQARFTLAQGSRAASMPPVGTGNVIPDLSVSDAGAGQVTLAWTQINAGDYNHDRIVNVADLVPLAARYGATYDRQAAGADLLPEYWIDGSGDGQLTLPDLTAIAANYYAYVHGYNIKRNGAPAGQQDFTQSIPRVGLPPRYSLTLAGLAADAWVVTSVDGLGVEGADSAGGVGPTDIRATLNITGLDLFSLYGTDSGAFGPGRWGLRVIEPIDDVDRTPVGKVAIAPLTATGTVIGLPRGTRYLVDILYAPVVSLLNGTPKQPAGMHGASAVDPADIVVSSIPVYLPPGSEPVDVTAGISLLPNPAGGYFVLLTADVVSPGDDPTTVGIIEDGYTRHSVTQLNYKDGLVSRDTDANSSFDDEAELDDSNRDCVSQSGVEQVIDDDEHDEDEREEIELEGNISAYDEATGTLTLINVTSDSTPGLPSTMTLRFSEGTRFEEKIREDSGDIEQNLDPSTLAIGDYVEAAPYALTQGAGGPADSYWLHELKRVIDNRT